MLDVPLVALRVVANVSVLAPVAGLGLNDAVVPLRKPDAVSVTLSAKPSVDEMVMLVLPLLPRVMLRVVGEAERLKSGAPVMVRETFVELARLPLTPLMVTEKFPVAAEPLAVKVRALTVAVLLGLNDAVTPAGRPETDKLTMPIKPFCGVTVIVALLLLPLATLKLFGEAESVKLPGGGVEIGQLLTKFVALMVPMPVAKSQPSEVPYAGANESLDVESTPTAPPPKKQLGPTQSTSKSPWVTS